MLDPPALLVLLCLFKGEFVKSVLDPPALLVLLCLFKAGVRQKHFTCIYASGVQRFCWTQKDSAVSSHLSGKMHERSVITFGG